MDLPFHRQLRLKHTQYRCMHLIGAIQCNGPRVPCIATFSVPLPVCQPMSLARDLATSDNHFEDCDVCLVVRLQGTAVVFDTFCFRNFDLNSHGGRCCYMSGLHAVIHRSAATELMWPHILPKVCRGLESAALSTLQRAFLFTGCTTKLCVGPHDA